MYLVMSVCLSVCSQSFLLSKMSKKINLWIFAKFIADTPYVLPWKWLTFGADCIAIFVSIRRKYHIRIHCVTTAIHLAPDKHPSACSSSVGSFVLYEGNIAECCMLPVSAIFHDTSYGRNWKWNLLEIQVANKQWLLFVGCWLGFSPQQCL